MKLSVPASCLKAALSRVSEAVARQSPHNPVFRCVLVRAADLVTVSATDTEIAARVTMTARTCSARAPRASRPTPCPRS